MAVDENKILMIYPSSSTNPQLFSFPSDINDFNARIPQIQQQLFQSETIIASVFEDDSIEYYELDNNDDVFLKIACNQGAPANSDCSANLTQMSNRGYMRSNKEFRNYEATAFFEIVDNGGTNERYLEIVGRTAYHTTSTRCCEGTGYGTRIHLTPSGSNRGVIENFKEEWHDSRYYGKNKVVNGVVPDFYQREFGIKQVVYNTKENNRDTVVIENYICPSFVIQSGSSVPARSTTWIKVSTTKDYVGAGWSANGTQCGAPTNDYPIFHGGIFVHFAWKGLEEVHFRGLSVREIQAPTQSTPTAPGTGDPTTPQVPSVPQNTIIYESQSKWGLASNTGTVTQHEGFLSFDPKVRISAGSDRELKALGDGGMYISGDQSRMYILASNYNSSMEYDYTPNSSITNLSTRHRSRHNAGGSCGNAFGGYGIVIFRDHVEFGDETCHDGGTHRSFGDAPISPSLVNGTTYRIRTTVKDVQNGVSLKMEIQRNGIWVEVGQAVDDNPTDAMIDKDLYLNNGKDGAGFSGSGADVDSYFWIRTNADSGTPEDIKISNLICRDVDMVSTTPPTQNPPPTGGGGTPPNQNPPPVMLDSNGIQWLFATGAQSVVDQSRDNPGDYRWSQNYENALSGFEVTLIGTFNGTNSSAHCALKHWGGNHSSPCTEFDGGCCCWYDTGIRYDGEVQTQIERPHPSNDDFACPECLMDNIGQAMEGNTIGLKWMFYPLRAGGSAEDGGIHLRMWKCNDALDGSGDPTNEWDLVYNIIDNGQILGDGYEAEDLQEIEVRISDTDDVDLYGGGVHVRYLKPGDPAGGGTDPGTGNCNPGYHKDENGLCVPDVVIPPNEDCPSGQVRDINGNCVPIHTGPNPPPAIPTSFVRTITFARNIFNNSTCKCTGIDVGTGTGGGGGGGTNEPNPTGYVTIYDVGLSGSTMNKMASVSNSTEHYLEFGQKFDRDSSVFVDEKIKQIEVYLAEKADPRGGTGDGVHVTIEDSAGVIKADFGYISEDAIKNAGGWHTVSLLNNEYVCKHNDKINFSYDGGDSDNYVKIFKRDNKVNTGSKIYRRNNKQSVGTFSSINDDIVMKVKVYRPPTV